MMIVQNLLQLKYLNSYKKKIIPGEIISHMIFIQYGQNLFTVIIGQSLMRSFNHKVNFPTFVKTKSWEDKEDGETLTGGEI